MMVIGIGAEGERGLDDRILAEERCVLMIGSEGDW